jgi:pimeloyl-ACP methyl ester carboxylesterase
MKKKVGLLVLSLLTLISLKSYNQEIKYGSNHGQYLDVYDTQIYFEEYGEGIPLLLLHGGSGSIVHFENIIPPLAEKFRVIAIDSPGHGRSEMSDSLSYQLLADYFSKCIDILELDSVYIVGWSDGGNAALILAADRPEKVKRALISGANFRLNGIAEDAYESIKSVNPEEVQRNWGSWKEEYLQMAHMNNDWRKFVTDLGVMWRQEIYVPHEKVEKIEAKFLIVIGDRDLITLEHGVEMYHSIDGSELLVLPNTGHMTFWDKPKIMLEFAKEFFKQE